jgi:hypothetical protein
MKSILFLLKLTWIAFTFAMFLIFFSDLPSERTFIQLLITTFFALLALAFHKIEKKYTWEDDYWALLFKTGYKKYSSKLKKSKARMKDELNDD